MKYLTDYIEDKQTEAFNKAGAFFAFSDEQFEEQEVKGVKYTSLGVGLICPVDNGIELIKTLDNIVKNGIKQDLKENGKRNIIERELENHEFAYHHELEQTIEALSDYPITEKEIEEVGRGYLKEFYKREEEEELKQLKCENE